jgi:heme/copper-type cytochrome/quinol oxidase subunit 2
MSHGRKFKLLLMMMMLLMAAWAIVADTAFACPTCKDGIQQGENAAGLVRGYFWSIIFMMSMPFLIFASLSAYFYWLVCRARRKHAADSAVDLTTPRTAEVG